MGAGGVAHRAEVAANHLAVADMLRAEVDSDIQGDRQVAAAGWLPERDGYLPLA